VASTLKIAARVCNEDPSVVTLGELVRDDPGNAVQVARILRRMTRSITRDDYEWRDDSAAFAILSVLLRRTPHLARFAAGWILEVPRSWWSRQLAALVVEGDVTAIQPQSSVNIDLGEALGIVLGRAPISPSSLGLTTDAPATLIEERLG
jgi:hypothetical protein